VLRRILLAVLALAALAVVVLGVGLWSAHRAIDRERAPLPTPDEIARFRSAPESDLPVRLRWINTASQPMPRAAVLDPDADPHPDEPYVMSHPAFVLEWADGRLLLIDAGMRPEEAIAFGKTVATLGGAGPLVAHGSIADALGDATARVRGLVFTHLHTDHVDGVLSLCAAERPPAATAFLTEAQATRPNYTTRPGLGLLEQASCVRREQLGDAALRPLPGFPGVAVLAAGGHTPGSQIVLARLPDADGERLLVFAGDIVNQTDGIRSDVPKPFLYRTLVVPESDERQAELRGYLAALGSEPGVTLLVSHDERTLATHGLASWSD